MALFIGIGVVLVIVIALVLRTARRTYKPEGPAYDVNQPARGAKLKAQDDVSRWSAGT